MLPKVSYRERVEKAKRPEEVMDTVHDHIWDAVNAHLGTCAHSFPELVEQLGIMRFGHRPRVADTFCGSGQIPFEAATARLRRLCLRPQPGGLHAHLGCLSHSWWVAGESRRSSHSSNGNWLQRCRPRSIGSASRPTAMAGAPRSFSTAWKHAARRRVGWCRFCRPCSSAKDIG